MKKNLWLALKRDKIWAEIYYLGEHIATIRVSEQNRGNMSILSLENKPELTFKIVKSKDEEVVDESAFNREHFNR